MTESLTLPQILVYFFSPVILGIIGIGILLYHFRNKEDNKVDDNNGSKEKVNTQKENNHIREYRYFPPGLPPADRDGFELHAPNIWE